MSRRALVAGPAALALAFAALALAPPAEAALDFKRCGSGFRCARLTVPLDRAGTVPGSVSLLVKRMRARRQPAKGATFAFAGGPGQSATGAFAGGSTGAIEAAFRTRDLIVFDQRGTGRSGVLRCRKLQRANLLDAGDEAAECAAQLGPARAFYTTPDTVEDIEAIRVAAGYGRIALFGTSYGSKVALAYALKYPGNVERLVLDSVLTANGPDGLYLDSFAGVPRVLRALCRARCRFTRDPVADLAELANRLAAGPMQVPLYDRRGRRREVPLSSSDIFALLVSGDFDSTLRSAFPAAVVSALRGDGAPMLRLKRRSAILESLGGEPARLFSVALYAATSCEELELPWQRFAPFEDRRRQAAERAAAVPPEQLYPFNAAAAAENDVIRLCERWPAAPDPPAFGTGPLPDVPVLLLEGEDDLRTPVESAQKVAAQFPQARLYVASATGHSALGSDFSRCIEQAFNRFWLDRRLPRPCPRRRSVRPSGPLPRTLADVKPRRGMPRRIGRTLRAALMTLLDVADDALFNESFGFSRRGNGGLRGGGWQRTRGGGVRLRGVRFVEGVRVSGVIPYPVEPSGRARVRVRGKGVRGRIRVRGGRVRGRLGGRRIRLRFPPLSSLSRASASRTGPPLLKFP